MKSEESEQVEKNMPLVNLIIQRHWKRVPYQDRGDLFQVGCIGLLKATRQFDPERGFAFSTYAYSIIFGEIRNYIRDNRPIKESRRLRETLNHIYALDLLDQTPEQISQRTGRPEKLIQKALEMGETKVSSINIQIKGSKDEKATVEDLIAVETDFSSVYVKDFLSALTDTEKQAVLLKLQGASQTEISRAIGVCQVSAGRFLKRAAAKWMERECACGAAQ